MTFSFNKVSACPKASIDGYAARLGVHGGAFLPCNLSGEVYEIAAEGASAGYLFTGSDVLSGFFLEPVYHRYAEQAFAAALGELGIKRARVLTSDSPLVALCCTRWKTTKASALCYEYVGAEKEPEVIMYCADESDRAQIESFGLLTPDALERLLKLRSLYVLRENGAVSAFGTVEWKEKSGLVGAAVRKDRRHCGMGSAVLVRLGKMLADYSKASLAVCRAGDTAFKAALEAAGYACFDKVIDIEFQTE